MPRLPKPLLQRAAEPTELGYKKNSKGEGPGSLTNTCVTFPASVCRDSDTIQIRTERKRGINKTLHSLPLFLSVPFSFCLLYYLHILCHFKNGF